MENLYTESIMWSIIQPAILSILLIYIAHAFWNYMIQVCTTKKKKNLVKIQNDKYASILQQFSQDTTEINATTYDLTDDDIAEMAADLTKSISNEL